VTRRLPLLAALLPCALALAGCRTPGAFELARVSETPAATTFRAGTGEAVFTPEKGYPLGGYGGGARREELPLWFGVGWPGRLALAAHQAWHEDAPDGRSDMLAEAEGVHDDLTAKALVLLPDEGPPLALVRIDAIGTTAELHDRVAADLADLGFAPETVVLAATHTHAGPGAFMRAPLACLIAMDNFRPEIEDRIAAACVEAVRTACAAARPARLGFARVRDRAEDGQTIVAKNRRARRFERGEVAYDAIDDRIDVLVVEDAATEALLGLAAVYAVHPTVLGMDNLHYSADLAGGIEDALEDRFGAPALFFNGAEGDVSPRRQETFGGLQRCRELGEVFANLVEPALAEVETADEVAVTCAWGEKELGSAWTCVAAGRGRFLDGDRGLGAVLTAPLTLPVNAFLWLLGFTDVRLAVTWNLAAGAVVDLDDHLDRHRTRLGAVRLRAGGEDVALLTFPGEPTHDLGIAARGQATDRGATRAVVLGLGLDHIGYIASEAEYRRGGYEAWSTLFGPTTGPQMLEAQRGLLAALGYR